MATYFWGIKEELTIIMEDQQNIPFHVQLIETQLKSTQDLLVKIDAKTQSLIDQ